MLETNMSFVIENDINPFVEFNAKGKITFVNKSGDMLNSINISKELYALALEYAPKNFGYKVSYMDLYYANKSFYAIMVAYQDENHICLSLYKKHIEQQLNKNNKDKTDINILIESSLEYFMLHHQLKIQLCTDYDMPFGLVNQNSFLILMRKLLHSYTLSSYIYITLKIKLGETIEVKDKRHYIIQVVIESDDKDSTTNEDIKKIAKLNNVLVFFDEMKTILEVVCAD